MEDAYAELWEAVDAYAACVAEATATGAEATLRMLETALREVAAEHIVPIEEMSIECLQQTLSWKMARANAALLEAADSEGEEG